MMAEVYRPSTSSISSISSRPIDPCKCKAGVWGNERWASYSQCSRKPVKGGWCKQHHPNAESERREKQNVKFQADMRKSAMGWYGEQFMAALIKIRDGDNDPRYTAAMALEGISYAGTNPQPENLSENPA